MRTTTIMLALSGYSFALADSRITVAAELGPRQSNSDSDPLLVGYISEGGSYNVRSCDPTETVSTSGAYFQCCPTGTGAAASSCAFYTTCRANTLYAADGVTVDCFVNSALTCNTGLVAQTAGAGDAVSSLACWQTGLGTATFSIVRETAGAGGSAAALTGSASSGTASSGAAMSTQSASDGSTAAGSATATATGSASGSAATSANLAVAASESEAGLRGRLVGALLAVVGPLLL